MSKPLAVLISDVHYNIHTLELADAAMRQAIVKANDLEIPLIVAGDLHDTKANLRGECINAMRKTFKFAHQKPYVLVGNHDKINEKSEDDSLSFLEDLVTLVSIPRWCTPAKCLLLPYYSDTDKLRTELTKFKEFSANNNFKTVIMHQGLKESASGEYIQDKSAITYEDVKDFRVVSGHYHTRQTIKTGRPQKGSVGLFDYIGNPYTLTFAEANDPAKGFQILVSDGTLQFVPTNLRKHLKVTLEVDPAGLFDGQDIQTYRMGDLVWATVHGRKELLAKVTKSQVAKYLGIQDFRLDLTPEETVTQALDASEPETQSEMLDGLIDSMTGSSDDQKARLKELWRKASCG